MARLSRRRLIGGASAGLAAAGLCRLGTANADNASPRVTRVLIVNAPGGLRSTAAFNASTATDLNPWGVAGTFGSVTLGNVLVGGGIAHDAPSWPTPVIPELSSIADQFAMIGAADHAPDGSHRNGDHNDDTVRMATGYFGKADAPGLLTVINRALGADANAPVAVVGARHFGIAPGDWLAHAPIELVYYQMPDQPPNGGHPQVGQLLEDALDQRYASRRRAQARGVLDSYRGTKDVMRKFGPLLAQPTLKMGQFADAEVDGITNQMLGEIGGIDSSGDTQSLGLAIRLLQLGSPAVALDLESFDWHDNEQTEAPQRYPRFARYLAGLHFALANIADPDGGGSLLDTTLVLTTSEFGRSGAPGGFNEGAGTDHGSGPGWRYQAHVLFGGGIVPKLIAPTDSANEPTEGNVSTHALLATIACAVGAPIEIVESVWPSGSALFPEGQALWQLWD